MSANLIKKQLSILNIKTNIKKSLNLDYENLHKSLFIYDVPIYIIYYVPGVLNQ